MIAVDGRWFGMFGMTCSGSVRLGPHESGITAAPLHQIGVLFEFAFIDNPRNLLFYT